MSTEAGVKPAEGHEAIGRAFHYLVELGYHRCCSTLSSDFVSTQFRSRTTAVQIDVEWRDKYVHVVLHRLLFGLMLPLSVPGLSTATLHEILLVRSPALNVYQPTRHDRFTIEELEKMLQEQALLLRTHAKDVLEGRFEVFRSTGRSARRDAAV